MKVYMRAIVAIFSLAALLVSGCAAQKQDLGNVGSVERPIELDKLNMFLGRWEGQFRVQVPGQDQPILGTGSSHYEWSCDRWVMVEHSQSHVAGRETVQDVCLWNWNAKREEYQLTWLDNTGTMMHATAQFDSDGKAMQVTAHGTNQLTGKHVYGQGTIEFTDPNTKVWTFRQWENPFKWGKPIVSSGSHRKQSS